MLRVEVLRLPGHHGQALAAHVVEHLLGSHEVFRSYASQTIWDERLRHADGLDPSRSRHPKYSYHDLPIRPWPNGHGSMAPPELQRPMGKAGRAALKPFLRGEFAVKSKFHMRKLHDGPGLQKRPQKGKTPHGGQSEVHRPLTAL